MEELKYFIATRDKKKRLAVTGVKLSKYFAARNAKQAGEKEDKWEITHLQTGYKLVSLPFATLELAEKFIDVVTNKFQDILLIEDPEQVKSQCEVLFQNSLTYKLCKYLTNRCADKLITEKVLDESIKVIREEHDNLG